MTEDRRAWIVIARMQAELKRQAVSGGVRNDVPFPDDQGRVAIAGIIDLAALANVTEEALRDVFCIELPNADQA